MERENYYDKYTPIKPVNDWGDEIDSGKRKTTTAELPDELRKYNVERIVRHDGEKDKIG